jgi:hypothetical protein
MAQNLMERLKAAVSPRARVADTATLLDDLKAERDRLTVARDQASAESIDFALSEDDRDAAAAKAGRLDRTIKGLEAEIVKVAALLEERRSDDARKAREAEKRAALTERDEIAARFAERVPAMITELTGMLAEIKANADRMKLAGVYEADAELTARGIPATGHVQMTPVARFIEMKIPEWASHGRSWPVPERNTAVGFDYGAQMQRAREERARIEREKAEAAAKFAAEHGTYEVTVTSGPGMYDGALRLPEELVSGNIPAAIGPWERKQLVIAHTVAEQLAKVPRLQVKRIDKGGKQ